MITPSSIHISPVAQFSAPLRPQDKTALQDLWAKQAPIVIAVAGATGKTSVVAMLESILLCAGYRPGALLYGHLSDPREAIRINGEVAESALEFSGLESLAAASLDVWLLELPHPDDSDYWRAFSELLALCPIDCLVVTNLSFDLATGSADRLTTTLLSILQPSAKTIASNSGQLTTRRPTVICGDPQAPVAWLDVLAKSNIPAWQFGVDFNYSGDRQQWAYGGRQVRRHSMAYPSLRGANQLLNASAALACLEVLRDRLVISQQAVRQGLAVVEIPGRFQVLAGRPTVIYDLGHCAHAAAHLSASLDQMGFFPFTFAVFGGVSVESAGGLLDPLLQKVDHWAFVGESSQNEALIHLLRQKWSKLQITEGTDRTVRAYSDAGAALSDCRARASENDRIIVYGSYSVVGSLAAN